MQQREPWNVEKCIFYKTYSYDDEEIMTLCFEKDWQQVSIKKLVGSSAEHLKKVARKCYPLIYELYRKFAGTGAIGNSTTVP